MQPVLRYRIRYVLDAVEGFVICNVFENPADAD